MLRIYSISAKTIVPLSFSHHPHPCTHVNTSDHFVPGSARAGPRGREVRGPHSLQPPTSVTGLAVRITLTQGKIVVLCYVVLCFVVLDCLQCYEVVIS